MADLQQLDKFADKQLDPIDVVLTGRHFLERLVDPRNKKPISAAELTGFFKRLARKKNEFVEFLKKYGEIVAKDNRTKINIPFMQQANKAIAKTIMRKDDFKTPSPELKFEVITEDTIKYLSKSLGMSRKDMPQISSKHIGDFVKYLNDKGVSVSPSVIDVSKIGMTQKDINVDKVKDLLGVEKSNLAKPVIISNDGYILDGHHRVAALYNVDKNFKLKTIKVDLGIKDLLKTAGEFPKVSYKGITEFYGNYNTRHIRPAAPMKGLGAPDDNWKDVDEGLITEGGAYGHMNHPFDIDINLTFGQLKDIVKKALKGELELTREKCIAGDTVIHTEKNGDMNIAEFVDNNVVDKVLSFNEETGQNEYMDVMASFNNDITNEWLEIELEDGKTIQVTPNHRMYVEGIGYVEAKDLTEGMELKIV
jgi:hypothetical protein